MHEWVKLLRDAIAAEGDRPTVMALATVSRNGSPRVRNVVCRRIDDDGVLWFVSDARSRKNQQIRLRRTVEVVFWMPLAKRQLRIRGEARIVPHDGLKAVELWRALPDHTRLLFAWPAPAIAV